MDKINLWESHLHYKWIILPKTKAKKYVKKDNTWLNVNIISIEILKYKFPLGKCENIY